jgi:hypothetical protein
MSCPAVLLIIACFASNAPCNPETLFIANVGICVSLQITGIPVIPDQATATAVPAVVGLKLVLISILLVPVLFVKCEVLKTPIVLLMLGLLVSHLMPPVIPIYPL